MGTNGGGGAATTTNKATSIVGMLLAVVVLAISQLASASAASANVDPTIHRSFADELTSNLYTKANECSSALGVSMAFSLLYPGSTGDGKEEIRNVLGYATTTTTDSDNNGGDDDNNIQQQLAWANVTERMLANSHGQCPKGAWDGVCNEEAPLLKIANSVWFDDGSVLNPDYEAAVGDHAKQIDLGAQDSPATVNEWVERSTNGLIDSVVEEGKPLYPPWELIAINSIYLKASWRHPFNEGKTNLDNFYGSASRNNEGVVSKAHFMNGVFDKFPYSHDAIPGYQIVQLPFTESQMSMVLVLPLSDGVGPVSSAELLPALNGMEPVRIALSVPKFRFESTYEDGLKDAIVRTGIVAPFAGGSFCNLFKDDDENNNNNNNGCNNNALFIDRIIQKTVIDVHEVGVEAAAVTAIMMGRGAPVRDPVDPISMTCDHPFQFFIHDASEDLVLFEGRLGAPEVPEGEPAEPLLAAARGGDGKEFWSEAFYVDVVEPPEYEVVEPRASSTPVEAKSSSIRNFICGNKCFSLIFGALLALALGFFL
jgi:serine protease inhibitor